MPQHPADTSGNGYQDSSPRSPKKKTTMSFWQKLVSIVGIKSEVTPAPPNQTTITPELDLDQRLNVLETDAAERDAYRRLDILEADVPTAAAVGADHPVGADNRSDVSETTTEAVKRVHDENSSISGSIAEGNPSHAEQTTGTRAASSNPIVESFMNSSNYNTFNQDRRAIKTEARVDAARSRIKVHLGRS